jgi:predicted DNA binding CopG/RHH family protein
MKHRNPKPDAEQGTGASNDELAREAKEWDERTRTPAGFVDAPEAVPHASRSIAISIRMPTQLIELLKRFAAREGVGYQVLLKRWLDDRLRAELAELRRHRASRLIEQPLQQSKTPAPGFPLRDRADPNGPHYAPGEP